jgi:hypothetical protein
LAPPRRVRYCFCIDMMANRLFLACIIGLVFSVAEIRSAHADSRRLSAVRVVSRHPSELPPTAAKRNLLKLWRLMGQTQGGVELLARLLDQGVRAADRARSARGAGDRRHAAQLQKLAGDWARLASGLLRTVAVERANEAMATRVADHETKLVRSRAVLAALHARRGRLRAAIGHTNDARLPAKGAAK